MFYLHIISIGEAIYHKLELEGKTPEGQYEILYNHKEN